MLQGRIRGSSPNVSLRSSSPNARLRITRGSQPVETVTSFGGKGYPIGLLLALTYTAIQSFSTFITYANPYVRIRNTQNTNTQMFNVVPRVRLAPAVGVPPAASSGTRYMLALALTSE